MKNNKVIKFETVLLSTVVLGVDSLSLNNNPVFGVTIVKAEEQQEPIKYRVRYLDKKSREIYPMYTRVLTSVI